MLKIRNATHFRRTVAALCLLTAPLFFAVALVTPQPSNSAAAQLASYAQHQDQLLAGVLFGIASSILFVPALFGLLHQIRGRGVVYAHVAATMIVYGLVTTAALWGVNVMFWEMAKPGMNRGAMVTLLNGLEHQPVAAPLLAGHYLFAAGVILLGVALWRANIAPRWAAILVAVFPLSDIVLSPVGTLASGLICGVIGVVGFGAFGWRMLAEPDAQWDQLAEIAAEPLPQPHPSAI